MVKNHAQHFAVTRLQKQLDDVKQGYITVALVAHILLAISTDSEKVSLSHQMHVRTAEVLLARLGVNEMWTNDDLRLMLSSLSYKLAKHSWRNGHVYIAEKDDSRGCLLNSQIASPRLVPWKVVSNSIEPDVPKIRDFRRWVTTVVNTDDFTPVPVFFRFIQECIKPTLQHHRLTERRETDAQFRCRDF